MLENFCKQLDTPGGHMLVCFLVIVTGAVLWKLGVPKAEDLIIGGSSVIFAAMRGVLTVKQGN